MSFFKKLKDRLFKSSSKIDEGLEAIVQEAADEAPAKQDREEAEVLLDSIDSQNIIEDLPPEPEPELKRSYRTKPLDPGQIEFMANKVTALVSCWEN